MVFQPGEVEQFISVKIVDDVIQEGVEMFTATLTTDDTNVEIPTRSASANVVIKDQDSKLNCNLTLYSEKCVSTISMNIYLLLYSVTVRDNNTAVL